MPDSIAATKFPGRRPEALYSKHPTFHIPSPYNGKMKHPSREWVRDVAVLAADENVMNCITWLSLDPSIPLVGLLDCKGRTYHFNLKSTAPVLTFPNGAPPGHTILSNSQTNCSAKDYFLDFLQKLMEIDGVPEDQQSSP